MRIKLKLVSSQKQLITPSGCKQMLPKSWMNSDAHEMKVNIYPESSQKIIICIKPLSSLEARPLSNTNISESLLWCNRQTEDSNHRSIKPDEVILYTGNRLVSGRLPGLWVTTVWPPTVKLTLGHKDSPTKVSHRIDDKIRDFSSVLM